MMFSGCSSLETIYASEGWNAEKATGSNMFEDCTKLVGGQGTAYNLVHIDYTYARIDGGASAPGYFTYKASTGINSLIVDSDSSPLPIYNLSGQRLTAPQKGVNIIGGKKVVVK